MPSSTATTKQKAYLRGRLQLLERGGYKFFSEGIVIFQLFSFDVIESKKLRLP